MEWKRTITVLEYSVKKWKYYYFLFVYFWKKNSQYSNFEEMTHSFQETLRHDDFVIMSDPCANLTWIEAFLTTSDHLDLYMHRQWYLTKQHN